MCEREANNEKLCCVSLSEYCFRLSLQKLAVIGLVALVVGGPPLWAASEGGDLVARGAYLMAASGCADCHTPMKMGPKGPEPDLSRHFSGHPEQLKLSPPPRPMHPGSGLVPPPIPLTLVHGVSRRQSDLG